MKRLLTVLVSLVSLSAFAQDIIICRNGDEISSKVLKISKTEIEYKKWANQDGPTYTLEKAEVFMIKYQNGEKDVFKEEPAAQAVPTSNQTAQAAITNEQNSSESDELILATPAANNAELIAQYNNATPEYVLRGKNQNKKAGYIQGTLGVTATSILSTDELEISFTKVDDDSWNMISGRSVGETIDYYYASSDHGHKYAIMIKNKTSRAIYVDKASCFGAYSTGKVKKYFDPQEFTVIEGGKSGTGASVNLGTVADAFGVGGVVGTLADGVNVGGDKGKMNLVTTTYKDDRILVVPPQTSVALSTNSCRDSPNKKRESIVTGSYECFKVQTLTVNYDEIQTFTEENSPMGINYTITYSFDKELKKCRMVNFGVYLKSAFGAHYSMTYGKWISRIKATSPKTVVVM